MPTLSTQKLLIVEDHPLYRDALVHVTQHCLPNSESHAVETILEAKKLLMETQFDLLVLDIELDDCSGLDLLEECRHIRNRPSVLVVSGHTRSDYVTRVLRLGATGYVSKASPRHELIDALMASLNGKLYLSNDVAKSVARATILNRGLPPHSSLSSRELEVFLLLSRGLQPKEVAARLNLSVRTVAVHKFKAFHKLGLRNMVEVFRYCQEHQLHNYETRSQLPE